jgi:hypothetical protein
LRRRMGCFFSAGFVLCGDPTEVHAPKGRRSSGWVLMC